MGKIRVGNLTLGDGDVKVCFPITGATFEEIVAQAANANASPCHLAEWRVDFFEGAGQAEKIMDVLPQIRNALGGKPLLFTFRTVGEGGANEVDPFYYFRLNRMILESGAAEAVDIELEMGREEIAHVVKENAEGQAKIFISKHIFECTPSEEQMRRLLLEMNGLGAHISKLAVMALSPQDVEKIQNCGRFMQKKYPDIAFVLIAMGEYGKITRRRKPYAGTVITYAKGKDSAAPGQLTVEELFEE